MYYEF
jgi:hypothetical protein